MERGRVEKLVLLQEKIVVVENVEIQTPFLKNNNNFHE